MRLRSILLGGLLVCAVLRPPELSPEGLALAVAFAAGILLLLLQDSPGRLGFLPAAPVPSTALAVWITAVTVSSRQPHRTLVWLLGAGFALATFLAARREPDRERRFFLAAFPCFAAVPAIYAVHQRLFGLADLARRLRALGEPDLDPAILRAESGRAFAWFLLPSALGIFLAMAIPWTLLAWKRSPSRWVQAGWGLLLAAQLGGLASTASYSALAALVGSALVLLALSRLPGRRLGAGILGAAGVAGVGAVAIARAGEGLAPLTLRIRNWGVAARVFRDAFWLGVGPGNFADASTRHLRAGMNETAYVHNSYLQIAAEAGVIALVLAAAGVAVFLVSARRDLLAAHRPSERLLLVLPAAAFLAHNLVDFSAHLPSLATVFAALLGFAFPAHPREPGAARAVSGAARIALAALVLFAALWGIREATASWLLERAEARLEQRDPEAAIAMLRIAARIDPADPDPPAWLAEALLAHDPRRAGRLAEGERWAARAVRLRPERAFGYFLRAAYRSAAGDPLEAWVDVSRARGLHPRRDLYRTESERLRESLATEGRK